MGILNNNYYFFQARRKTTNLANNANTTRRRSIQKRISKSSLKYFAKILGKSGKETLFLAALRCKASFILSVERARYRFIFSILYILNYLFICGQRLFLESVTLGENIWFLFLVIYERGNTSGWQNIWYYLIKLDSFVKVQEYYICRDIVKLILINTMINKATLFSCLTRPFTKHDVENKRR